MLMGALCRALRNSSSKGELKDTYVCRPALSVDEIHFVMVVRFRCSHSIFDVDRKNETQERLRKTLNEAKTEARSKTNGSSRSLSLSNHVN